MSKRIRCIDQSGNAYITKGVVYEVEKESEHFYTIKSGGTEAYYEYDKRLFKVVSNYPNPPHKHAELIKAWADGAEIEYRGLGIGSWHDTENKPPIWSVDNEYRVKPSIDADKLQKLSEKLHKLEHGMDSLQIDIEVVKHEIVEIQYDY